MTGKEMDNFYKQDKRKYIVKENLEFLTWYQEQLDNDYSPYLDLDQIQGLINKLTRWYEIKYPNTLLMDTFKQTQIISQELTIDQLKFRITHDEKETLDCNYRGTNVYYRKDNNSLFPKMINIYLDKNGIVAPYDISDLEDFLPKFTEPTTVINILKILKEKNISNLDYTELERCILTHQIDLELRNKILYLASLSLLYSNTTNPKIGFIRAQKLISEFNEYYHLDLNTDELTQIISKNYQEELAPPILEVEPKEESKPKTSILKRIRMRN